MENSECSCLWFRIINIFKIYFSAVSLWIVSLCSLWMALQYYGIHSIIYEMDKQLCNHETTCKGSPSPAFKGITSIKLYRRKTQHIFGVGLRLESTKDYCAKEKKVGGGAKAPSAPWVPPYL